MRVGVVAAVALVAGAGASAVGSGGRRVARWAADEPIPVWIENVNVPAERRGMVERAVQTWAAAAQGRLRFEESRDFPRTGIRIRFVADDVHLGEAMPSVDRATGAIVRADVVLSIDYPGDRLQKQLVLYLTALHEIGHALGLGHSDNFDAIMYRFRRPADPERFFLRYRRRLRSAEDIGSAQATGLAPEDRAKLLALYRR